MIAFTATLTMELPFIHSKSMISQHLANEPYGASLPIHSMY